MSDTPERDEAGAWRTELVRLAPDRRQAWLLANVRAAAARFLALPGDEPVGADTPWTGLGFDSLRAIDFTAWLARATGVALRSTLLFDEPTPERVTRHLLAALGFAPATLPLPPTSCAAPRATPPDREPIAIVGAACRVPGAETLQEFWQLLCDGRDAVAPIPRERFDVDALYDPDPAAEGRMYVREAGLLREHDGFDPAPFALSPREAVMLDPQQRWLLETTWHALEHANLPPRALAGARVGVYVAVRASEYFDSQSSRTTADASAWTATGNAVSTAAGRLSYTFGFRGPCYAFDTACSGSLVAVHLAVRALRARECDVAIAGGVNAILDPVAMVGLCRARMLSADGRCKAFDARADGYGRGEGCGVIVVKRLADALAAGDRVLAIVRGTAINQDGRSSGLTVPHGPAQGEVIRDALADAGVAPSDIDFVEAHGTGTQLGDPIEVQALDTVFAQRGRPLPIGTVKTNVGHLEAAAGIAGLLKAALALRARVLPATLHFQRGNPHIDWARTVAQVVTSASPLRKDGAPLLAGVSSFGFSGTNCHVVLASPPDDIAAPPDLIPDGPWLLPLQAMDAAALRALAVAHANALAAPATDLAAWCHAAAAGRTPLPQRAAFVASSREQLLAALHAFAAGDERAATAAGTALGQPPPAPVASRDAASPAALAAAWVRGAPVDFAVPARARGPLRAALPLYPFQRRRFWLQQRALAAPAAAHPLLGERRDSSLLASTQMLFAASITAQAPAWLADHRVGDQVLLPAAAMCEVALAAEAGAGTALPITLRNVALRTPCRLGVGPHALELLRTADGDGASFRLQGRAAGGRWLPHLAGRSGAGTLDAAGIDVAAVAARCRSTATPADLYGRWARLGLRFGPAFQCVRTLRLGDGEVLATIELPPGPGEPFVLHPLLLDACWHSLLAALPGDTPLHLPIGVEELTVHRRAVRRAHCHARLRAGTTAPVADFDLADDDGTLVAQVRGLQLLPADPASLAAGEHDGGADEPDRIAVPPAPFRVRQQRTGDLGGFECVPAARSAPAAHEVEVAMSAAALNWKDVLHARGRLRAPAAAGTGEAVFGFEGTGIVTAAGASVHGVRPGDHVAVLAPGCLASHVTVAADAVVVLPASLDPLAAAAAPVAYATVLHAFDLAAVKTGDSLLVHAAAGGVGQAAIAVARARGCRVLATTSAGKRGWVEAQGIAVVGDTRGGGFTDGVLAATGGRGVDLVLNTLGGAAVGPSLRALALGGRFVELGKLGVWSADEVRAERPDVAFFTFDLGDEFARVPGLRPALLARVRDGLVAGTLPPPAATTLPLADLTAAFAWLANGHSIGKVILSIADSNGRAAAAPPRSRTRLASPAIPPPARREVAAIATATPPGLRTAVRAAVAAVLGFPDPGHLAADRPFRDYGLDSLLAIDAKDRIEPLVGCDLPANLLFDFPDLDQLVAHLQALLDRQARAPTNATASTSTRKP